MLVQSAFFHHLLSIEVTPPGVESFGAVVGKFEREEVYFQTPDFEGSQFLLEGGTIFQLVTEVITEASDRKRERGRI